MKTVHLCHFKVLKRNTELTQYITYTGYVHAIKTYIRQTGLTTEGNSSLDLIKTLKIIYTQQKGAHLYYEVLTQDTNKPNSCEKWEAKLNKDINWSTTFKKIPKKSRK